MSDRRLLIGEFDPTDTDYGKMLALSPNRASGVPIPAFRFGATKPAAGTSVGEAFYEGNSQRGFVWNGTSWREIASSALKLFATEADLLADTGEPVGTMATSSDVGLVYARQPGGWQVLGVKDYANFAALLADSPTAGSLGLVLDENSLWQMTAAGWRSLTLRELTTTAAVVAWAGTGAQGAHVGDQALAAADGLLYIRTTGGWRPSSIWEETEANIRAATWPLNGQEAIATDTGRTFVRIAGAWVEEPIQHYATEADLLAATPANGTLAWSDDTNWAFTRSGGAWNRLGGPNVTASATDPQAGGAPTADGDLWADTGTGTLWVWSGGATGAWAPLSTSPITVGGTIPAAPAVGDMFYDNTDPTGQRLGVRFWDGTDWRGVHGTQFGTNFPGSEVAIPLYGNHSGDLDNTHTPVGVVGLMAESTGGHPTLWMKYNDSTFIRLLPQMGIPANAGRILEANPNGVPQWVTPKPTPHVDEHHETGVSTTYFNFTGKSPTKYFHMTGSLQPLGGTGPYIPRLFLYHDTAWLDWGNPQFVFETDVSIWWPNTVAAHSGMAGDNSGVKLVPTGSTYEPGLYATMTYDLFITGFGLQGTNDRVMITVRSGPYKNADGTYITFNFQARMGPSFDPTKVTAIGMNIPTPSTAAFSMQATWL